MVEISLWGKGRYCKLDPAQKRPVADSWSDRVYRLLKLIGSCIKPINLARPDTVECIDVLIIEGKMSIELAILWKGKGDLSMRIRYYKNFEVKSNGLQVIILSGLAKVIIGG